MNFDLNSLLNRITAGIKNILSDNLTGIYLHGSAAFGCFNPSVSDIDVIIVVKKEPCFETKKKVIAFFLELSEISPAKGLEMSIVLKKHCTDFIYPTPYCMHFSPSHIDSYQSDMGRHIRNLQGTDKDLAAHFTIIKHCGITLYGEDIKSVFGDVPKEHYIDSILFDIENASVEIADNPVYLTLNLFRVLAYVKDGLILSKAEGGMWGAENLPQYRNIAKIATEFYTSNIPADFENLKLKKMAENILEEIYKNIK